MKKEDKPFLTYEEQIHKLKKDKKLKIENEQFAISLLKQYSYFDLISGYKSMFKSKTGTYKPNTSIEDIYALYCFDVRLRALFLKYILKIEKHIKSLISYSFCEKYGNSQNSYLSATNYNYTPKNIHEVNKLIAKLSDIVNNPSYYPYIYHQKTKYGNIPLWVMLKALTIGTVSKMYSFLPQTIQYKVSKEFDCVNESMLTRMLDLLSRVRNVCAHNERLYDYKYKKGTIDDTNVHKILDITKRNNQYTKGKRDLFAVVIVFKYLLQEEDFISFCQDLIEDIDILNANTSMIQKSQLYKKMGFPENWMEIDEKVKIVKAGMQS